MPATLGQKLTAARERRGLSIEDVAHETRISPQRLRQIEAGDVAGFGSMTYARSFIRAYSEFLEVDAESFIEGLPEGLLGGQRDYRYLTESHGPWVPERRQRDREADVASPTTLRRIKSPLPAGLGVFAVLLVGTAIWGHHVAQTQAEKEPAALKALPVEDRSEAAPSSTASGPAVAKKMDFPTFVRKAGSL